LPSYYIGTINLYGAKAALYAINGNIDKAISTLEESLALTKKFVLRKEPSNVTLYP
jgi:hypothetical protein